jgi:hypothetical protein
MALSATVALAVNAHVGNTLTLGTSAADFSGSYGAALTDGAGAGLANRIYWATRTLTASSTETLDFAGTLLDQFGAAITFARLKVLVVSAAAANTNNVVIGGGATTFTGLFGATTHTVALRPGTVAMWCAGVADATAYAVTAGSTDLLQVANSAAGTSVSYDVVIIGTAT